VRRNWTRKGLSVWLGITWLSARTAATLVILYLSSQVLCASAANGRPARCPRAAHNSRSASHQGVGIERLENVVIGRVARRLAVLDPEQARSLRLQAPAPLGEVPDRRGLQGQQYKLQSLPGISIGAMLAGANDLRAIFRWGRRLKPEALRLLGIEDGKAPCHATYHYVFKSLDGDALASTLGSFARGGECAGHIAIDGKTLKGSRRLDGKALHVLSAFATDLGAVIGDLVVEPDQNEITAAMALIKELPLDGAVITGDAIFCQRELCRHIRDAKGHYLFVVKDNQPELKASIAESFGDLSPLSSRRGGARRSAAA
jgi:hypothetical protein